MKSEEEKSDDGSCVTETMTRVEVHAPGGFWGRLTGRFRASDLFLIIVIGLIGLALFVQAKDIALQQEKATAANTEIFLAQHRVTQSLLRDIVVLLNTGQAKNERAQVILTYVISRSEKERAALNLQMPEELRSGKYR